MDSFKKYFIKPLKSTAILSQAPIPRLVYEHLLKVYCALGYTLVSALFGAFSHLYFDIGGLVTAVGFIATLYWMSKINPWREHYRAAILIAAAHFFGSTIGPAINLFFDVNQSFIIKMIMGGIVFCSCHFGACIHSEDRFAIYEMGEFSTPVFITTWMIIYESYPGLLAHSVFLSLIPFPWFLVISMLKFYRSTLQIKLNFPIHLAWVAILCYFFKYPFLDLVIVYVVVVGFLLHMRIYIQDAIYIAAHHNDECYYINTTITFFTEFLARTISLILHTEFMKLIAW